ncbi:MAG TPA: PIG-L deacetylase family protein [Burkholderiales bacterium]|jgi:LmbE family N-acetylglucosaminyl deacetylase|nr:PIG-L deacetylase family protein [Burkholderiales bacterium]
MNMPMPKLGSRSFTARYAGSTVLAIGAHPDDLELGIGGTLARLARGGARVVMTVVSIPGAGDTRRREAERAAAILGCELRVLLEQGRRIEDVKHYELVAMLDAEVRELSPSAVFTHSASEFHRDHVAVYNACLSSQRLVYFDFFSYHPTMCRPVPMPFHPRAYVDVTSTIDVKMQAIDAHESQFACRGISTEMYRDIARLQGRMVGVPYAEGLDVGRMVLA